MPFFTSPTSNIPPTSALAIAMHSSTAMTRTSSSDSTRSTSSAYSSSSYSSGAMAIPMHMSSSSQRRSSSSSTNSASGWVPSPFRSCLQADESSSYLSDDELLFLEPPTEVATATSKPRRELTTEEHIALLREQAEREEQNHYRHQPLPEAWWQQPQKPTKKAKVVRFAVVEAKPAHGSRRRSSTTMPKQRTPTVRRNLNDLGAAQ